MVGWLKQQGVTWVMLIGVVYAAGEYKAQHDQDHAEQAQAEVRIEKNTKSLRKLNKTVGTLNKFLKEQANAKESSEESSGRIEPE